MMSTWNMADIENRHSRTLKANVATLGIFAINKPLVKFRLRPEGLEQVYRMLGEDYSGISAFDAVKLRFSDAESARRFQLAWELRCNTTRECPFKLTIDEGVQFGESKRGNLLVVDSVAPELLLTGPAALEELGKHIDIKDIQQTFRGFNHMLLTTEEAPAMESCYKKR